jgi:galactitol-specific phosphotransferase system IIC component
MGIMHTVLFVSTQASADPHQASAAVSTLLLSNAIGIIIGVACLSAAMKEVLQRSLEAKLLGLGLDAATRLEVSYLIQFLMLFERTNLSGVDYFESGLERRIYV